MSDTSHALIIFFSLIKNAADSSYKIALFKYWILLYYYDRKIFHNCFATYRISLIIKKCCWLSGQDFLFEKYWLLLLKLAEIFQLLFYNLLIIQQPITLNVKGDATKWIEAKHHNFYTDKLNFLFFSVENVHAFAKDETICKGFYARMS